MAQTLILAKNITEANEYARAVGLERFSYRAVRSAGSIKGVRNAEVHLLPSFLARPDRHAILSVLSFARTLEVIYADPADFAPAEGSNALESGTPPTDEEIEAAYAEHDERERSEATNGSVEPSLAPSNAELTAPFEPTRTNDAAVTEAEPSLVEVVTDGEHKTQESLTEAARAEIATALETEKVALEELAKVADSPKVTEAVEAKVEHLDAGLEALVADQKVPAKTTRKSRQKAATPANDFF